MESIEERILAYPHRPEDERREIESFVEKHPRWAPLLHDVRAVEALVRGPLSPGAVTGSEALLATYVVMTSVHPEAIPSALQDAFTRIEDRMDEDPALEERMEAFRRRLDTVESAIEPAVQFERLTGQSLSREPATNESDAAASEPQSSSDHRAAGFSLRAFLSRLSRMPTNVRWAGGLAVLLLATYGGLYAVSTASQSTLDRLATIDVNNRIVESYADTNTRSAVPDRNAPAPQGLYIDALSTLRGARTSTLGLFPRYDADSLARARHLLTEAVDQSDPDAFLTLEAQFYLGKVALAQERAEAARSHFQTVVAREGRRADDARRILNTLREEHPEADSTAS